MGIIDTASAFVRTAWYAAQGLNHSGFNPVRLLEDMACFHENIKDFDKKITTLPTNDAAATMFKESLADDARRTFHEQGKRAFFAISISETLEKIISNAKAVRGALPNNASSELILEEAQLLQKRFEALDDETKKIIEKDIRGKKESCPMNIIVDLAADEVDRRHEISDFLLARPAHAAHVTSSTSQPDESRQVRRARLKAKRKNLG